MIRYLVVILSSWRCKSTLNPKSRAKRDDHPQYGPRGHDLPTPGKTKAFSSHWLQDWPLWSPHDRVVWPAITTKMEAKATIVPTSLITSTSGIISIQPWSFHTNFAEMLAWKYSLGGTSHFSNSNDPMWKGTLTTNLYYCSWYIVNLVTFVLHKEWMDGVSV